MKTVLLFFTGFILSPIILEAASFWHTTPLGFVIYQVMAFRLTLKEIFGGYGR